MGFVALTVNSDYFLNKRYWMVEDGHLEAEGGEGKH
jgi:hypothetical protein